MKKPDGFTVRLVIAGSMLILIHKLVNNFSGVKSVLEWWLAVVFPLALGCMVALVLYIPSEKIEKLLKKSRIRVISERARGLSVLIVYFVIISISALILAFIVPKLYKSLQELAGKIPEYTHAADGFFSSRKYLKGISVEKLVDSGLSQYVNATKITGYFRAMKGFTGTVISVLVSIVISVYLLVDREGIQSYMSRLLHRFPALRFQKVTLYVKKTVMLFASYFSGLAADAFTVAVIVSVGAWLLGVKYPLVIGTVVGIGNLVPVFGSIASTFTAAVLSLVSGGLLSLITVILFLLTVYVADAYFIQPFIVGKSTGVKPVVSLIAVTVFGKIFGVPGALVAVPLVASLKMLLDDVLNNKKPT